MSDDRRSRSRSPDRDRSPARDHNNGPPSSPPRDNHAPSNGGSGDASSSVKLYIGNIDYGTDDQRLRQTFEKYGAITDAFVPTERESRRPRGFGFVTFARREDAEKAMHELDNTELDGRTIRISESRPRSTTTGPFNASGAADVKLFVGNLSFETETEKIRTLFSTVGEVKDCYMPTDRSSNRPRGFAFVTMSSNDAEDAIKKLIGEDIDGRAIRIEEAGGKSSRPRGEDNFRGGGDRGGFGGGGGYGGGGGAVVDMEAEEEVTVMEIAEGVEEAETMATAVGTTVDTEIAVAEAGTMATEMIAVGTVTRTEDVTATGPGMIADTRTVVTETAAVVAETMTGMIVTTVTGETAAATGTTGAIAAGLTVTNASTRSYGQDATLTELDGALAPLLSTCTRSRDNTSP
eukprot:CAMPEP_0197241466 /NCGR_PEP_ID=MMETSP1429-20130617/7491_1 /TAXON_ID=49237 /ORGANISM="Chaetoceros  sp., Strain UNC1202" /LENGTH=404 /DNA_ID=CAMNT_0042701305 /DNA_START=110 /DNA_END=1325 /DNA_ORIENTATION=+